MEVGEIFFFQFFYVLLTVFCTTASSWCVRFESPCIICFKIKNPPPVELCWQKQRNPENKFHFFGLAQRSPKFNIELLSLFT
jgi:hypothetical protein